jgi:hypothetical protein
MPFWKPSPGDERFTETLLDGSQVNRFGERQRRFF